MFKTLKELKLISLSSLGGALEFFDFAVYGLLAPYLKQLFFPKLSYFLGIISVFAIFSIGYLAKPLGGIIISHVGDKYGRKIAFQLSLSIMTLATLLTGCLPTYTSIGIMAPILLFVLRLAQSMATGGEISGSAVFTAEILPAKQKGLVVGVLLGGITLGTPLAAALTYFLTLNLTHADMLKYGWRIPFFAGLILGLIGTWLRTRCHETPIFEQMKSSQKTLSLPLKNLILNYHYRILLGIGLMCLTAGGGFTLYYMPLYLNKQLGLNITKLFLLNTYNFTLVALLTGFFGWASDHISRIKLLMIGSLLTSIAAIGLSIFLPKGNLYHIAIISSIFIVFFSFVNISSFTLLLELFPTNVRCSGMTVSYNIGFGFFVGIAPIVTTAHAPNHFTAVIYYLCALALITFLSSIILQANNKKIMAKTAAMA